MDENDVGLFYYNMGTFSNDVACFWQAFTPVPFFVTQLSTSPRMISITGCAVAQHCCNDDQQSQWEIGDFDPL